MAGRTITVTLPEALYERVKETAEASSWSLKEVLAQTIALSFPALERDLSLKVRSKLVSLSVLSDTELWNMTNSTVDEEPQARLEVLVEVQKQRSRSATD